MFKMSAKSSGKKNSVFNEANEALYDAFQAVELPDYFPIDPPWPEWNDADVNAETWGNGNKLKTQATSKETGKTEAAALAAASDSNFAHYVDPEPGNLPPELGKFVSCWKRPHEVFPPDKLTVYEGSRPQLSLSTPSEVASNCELFKATSNVYRIIHFYAAMEPFPTEYETPSFIPNTRGQPWQPWHHIYGSCKILKDQPHRPVYTPYGKYIIRLYYLGVWRKFVVDDLIPCDGNGKCMLPVTPKLGELWPILLIKGILKISSLTPTSFPDLMGLPLWTMFTGWVLSVFPIPNKTINQTWRLIYAMGSQYSPTEEKSGAESRNIASMSSKGTAKKRESQEKEERAALMIADLGIFLPGSELHGNSYSMPLLMTREVPLVKARPRKATEPWKRIRWVHWAESKGLWVDEQLIPPYRCVRVINFSQEANKLVLVDPEMEDRLFVKEEDPLEEEDGPLIWADFYKFFRHLTKINFLIKPSSLISQYRMTYMSMGSQRGTIPGAGKPKAFPTAPEPSTYYMLPTIKFSGNDPPIVCCESVCGIFISFSLWVCPRRPLHHEAYLSPDQPDFLTVYRGSLIVEEYDWRLARQNKVSIALKTVGTENSCVFLNPGRHALRLWLDTDSQFLIDVHSNTELTVGKGPKIRFAMSTESLMITEYVNRVSDAFYSLTQKFGSPDQGYIFVFFKEIKPRNTILEGYERRLNYFLDAFATSIVIVLRSLVTNEEELYWMGKALRSLFLDPYIPSPVPKIHSGVSVVFQKKAKAQTREFHEQTASGPFSRISSHEESQSAVTIQRMYRGFAVRQLFRYRSPNNKEHKIMVEKLKKICELMFAPSKRDVEVARLIRETIAAEPALLETFLFYRDIANVTVTEEFTGKIAGVEPNAWVPMIRFIFACHSQDPLPCAFYHSCNLEQYTVTVTDNDTNLEIFRLINTTGPHYYRRNETGYTLFVYGWNESDPKTVYWRLEMVKMKYFLDIHPCDTTLIGITGNSCHPYQPQPLSMQELRNFYIPNKLNKICTCLFKVRKRILATIRLSVSFEDARFCARITRRTENTGSDSDTSTDGNNLVAEAEAKSSAVIFPTVLLDHDGGRNEQRDNTEYVLEAFVLYNSWPLTRHEWGIVELMRMNGEASQDIQAPAPTGYSRKSSSASRKKSLRSSKTGLAVHNKAVENPYWYLQIVTDDSQENPHILEVTEDRSYQELIKGMKLSWEENDPGRRHKGKAVRYEFLRVIHDEMAQSYANAKISASGSLDVGGNLDVDSLHSAEDSFQAFFNDLSSFSYLLNDKTCGRYLKSQKVIPWTPMNGMFARYSCGKLETDMKSSTVTFADFEGENYIVPEARRRTEEIFQEERKKLLILMRNQSLLLEEHMTRERALSAQLMEEAYEGRRKLVDGMKVESDAKSLQKNK